MTPTTEQCVEQALRARDTDQLARLLLEHLMEQAIAQDRHRIEAQAKVDTVLGGSCSNWKDVFFEPDGRVNWDAIAEFNRRWSVHSFTQRS